MTAEPFEFELTPRLKQILERIDHGRCSQDDLREIGTSLHIGLLSGEIKQIFTTTLEDKNSFFQLRLKLPPILESLPWEALHDQHSKTFLAEQSKLCIIRDADCDDVDCLGTIEPASIIQLIAAAPEGAGLYVETEIKNLEGAAAKLPNITFQSMRGLVTPDRIATELQASKASIFHFIGHGEIDNNDRLKIRVNNENGSEFWQDAEPFVSTFTDTAVRLAVFNCCQGGQPSPGRGFGGVGQLLRWRAIPAVVAMRYPIDEDVAIRFSNQFYTALASGSFPGRVDVAIQAARLALYRNSTEDNRRGFITPILHLDRRAKKLFEATLETRKILTRSRGGESKINLPENLIAALREKRCVPIVGAQLVAPPSQRRAISGPSLQTLIEKLAHDSRYPDTELLRTAEDARLRELAFESVAEHYANTNKRFRLLETVSGLCAAQPLTSVHSEVAKWATPALFYTHFDGMMEAAYQQQGRIPTTVNGLKGPIEARQGEMLILVRGTINDPASLVLTEREREELEIVIAQLPAALEQLTTREIGRSIVLLGVSPRDPVVRRLARKLIIPDSNQDAAFFISPNYTACDEGYWGFLKIEWIRADPDAAVAAITSRLQGGI